MTDRTQDIIDSFCGMLDRKDLKYVSRIVRNRNSGCFTIEVNRPLSKANGHAYQRIVDTLADACFFEESGHNGIHLEYVNVVGDDPYVEFIVPPFWEEDVKVEP